MDFRQLAVTRLLRWPQNLRNILTCAYKRNRKRLDFPIENEKGAILTLTLRLRRRGKLGHPRYHADLIGGKGGTRTLDPGIMSGPRLKVIRKFNHLPRGARCTLARRSTTEHY